MIASRVDKWTLKQVQRDGWEWVDTPESRLGPPRPGLLPLPSPLPNPHVPAAVAAP